MVVAGLLLVLVAVALALWRPPAWRSPGERTLWLVALTLLVPSLFISIVGPIVALLAVAAYAVRVTATSSATDDVP